MSGVKMGGVQMVQVDGQFHVWTKRVGSGPIQVLTLHGGPGCTHEYFECFEDFLRKKESSSFTMTSSARRILISRRIPASGRWSGFAKRWSRLGRHSAWINSTSTDIPGAA